MSSSKMPAVPPRPGSAPSGGPTLESLDRKLDTLIGNVGLLFQDNEGLHKRMALLETQRAANVTSERVRGIVHESTSKADLAQGAALADEKIAREALAKEVQEIREETKAQTAMLKRIEGVGVAIVRSKTLRNVAQILGPVVAFYVAHWLGMPLPFPTREPVTPAAIVAPAASMDGGLAR